MTDCAAARPWSTVIEDGKVKRTLVCATSAAMPSAVSTCEGSSEPTAQAEPLDAVTPQRSSSSSTASPEVFEKQNDAWFGVRD